MHYSPLQLTNEQPTPCREWQGARTGDGYGTRTRNGKHQAIHRWIWEQINGPIPDGMCVLHRCDNPPCFRYDHLFLGTKGDNVRDMVTKGRFRSHNAAKTHCPAGHPYDDANIYRYTTPAGYVTRTCKTCSRVRGRANWHKRKQTD